MLDKEKVVENIKERIESSLEEYREFKPVIVVNAAFDELKYLLEDIESGKFDLKGKDENAG